ncbi:PAS domain S-box protein [Bradyrhizobium lablabi]|uniref:PAS domain S-box protein n=1 Tax=Bradyrhizobium lablabi TaxID=722472 RepID=UPI001BA8F3A3|nr:PAS domain S-box protein [Bradyrhizobium lablabi]MBR1124790.1 PAS domain S-box protein [Bradyrhizobium lablabi]
MTLSTRLAIAMILLVAIAVSAVGWLSYRNLEQALLPRVLDRIETHSRFVAGDLASEVRSGPGDITTFLGLASVTGLMRALTNGGVDPVDGTTEALWRERLEGRLAAQMALKPAHSLRFIGIADGHREIVRVDRSGPNGAVRIVPEAELRRVGDAPYFADTIKLAPGEVYVSPISLNEENGVIETPPVPTMRIAKPVMAPDGKPFGIVIVNVDMRAALDRVRTSGRPGENIYLVDRKGDYLIHPDRTLEFGSQTGKPGGWWRDLPYLAASAGATQGFGRLVPDGAGRSDGVAFAPTMLAGSQWVAVVELTPNAVFMAPASTIQNSTILVGLIAVLCAAVLALLIARSLTGPITRLTEAVEGAADGRTARIPVDAPGETGVLARAFVRVMDEANAKTIALEREVEEHRRTEAARERHAEREHLFSAAVESSNDAIITLALDGTITGWNLAAERLYGYSAAEAVGKNVAMIVPPERLSEVEDTRRRIGWGERIEQNETVRIRKNGTPVDVALSISPIKSPSGETIGISKVARDITEANRTRATLRQQTEERRRIFETSQDLILVMDSRGILVQVSPSSKMILGYLPEELIGKDPTEFVVPDYLENSRKEMRATRRGQRFRMSDTQVFHKDGRAVWLSWLGTWSEPVQRYFFVGRDMTESRLAQESLRESEQLARGIIDTALDAFVQMDETGTIIDWNSQAEKIFGWPRAEALGRKLGALIVPPDHREAHRAGLEHFLRTGENRILGRRLEIEALRRDGREIKVELSITELRRRGGVVFNGFIRDLTDKIAAEDRIRHAEKMEAIGQLTGGIAHDFNNILTVITGTIEILGEAVADQPQLSVITRMIDEAASRGAELTQHLLAFARKQPLQPREVDINTLIIDTAKLLRPALGEPIEVESVFEDEACFATVDPNQLATAILNLALNARDAMPDGGKLIIETGSVYLDENYARTNEDVRPGRYAMIAVSDTGAGIPAAILDRVFDPFFTSKGPGKGTGLGLSMVYGFVKQSAGHIKIYSEEGHGTTIRMYLPPGTGSAIAPEIQAPAVQGGSETILVVEDDKLVRDYVLAQLRSLGYVTLDAGNAVQALAIVDAGHPFDLLFTDVIMPGSMNGRQLADEIEKRRPGLKVLFTSGYTENAIIHHGRLDAGVLLLPKPYRKSDLASMIRTALGG